MSEAVSKPLFGGKAPTPIPWEPLPHMDEYLQDMDLDEQITPQYAASARTAIAHFAQFCKTEGIRHPAEIQRFHLLRFQAYLNDLTKQNGEPLALSYKQQIMKYVRRFINWMVEIEHIEANPWVRIRIGSVRKKPKPLEADEIYTLFEAHRRQAFSISPFFYHRREVILVLLFGWGLRINELAALSITSVDMRLDYVTSRNKGKNERTKVLPYSSEMKMVVQRYLIQRGSKAANDDTLLIDQQGQPLSVHMIRKIVSDLGTRAGVPINPHRFRDTLGTTLLDNDVPAERVQQLLGHATLGQTLQYSRVGDRKVKESHDEVVNPLLHKLLGGEAPLV